MLGQVLFEKRSAFLLHARTHRFLLRVEQPLDAIRHFGRVLTENAALQFAAEHFRWAGGAVVREYRDAEVEGLEDDRRPGLVQAGEQKGVGIAKRSHQIEIESVENDSLGCKAVADQLPQLLHLRPIASEMQFERKFALVENFRSNCISL